MTNSQFQFPCSVSAMKGVALSLGLALTPIVMAQQTNRTAAQARAEFRNENAATPAAPLSADQLAIAQRVQTGRIPCELGQSVAILPDPAAEGYFLITTGKDRYRARPVPTTTGAIRLEDKARGGVWLQLANKSMLLDEKNGRRLADECMSPAQQQVAQELKRRPPPSVIDLPSGASSITTRPDDPLPAPQAAAEQPASPNGAPGPVAPLNLSLPTR